MAFGEWDWDEAKAAWQEEAREEVWEEAEAKYQPILAENRQALAEKDRENQELRQKLREAGIYN